MIWSPRFDHWLPFPGPRHYRKILSCKGEDLTCAEGFWKIESVNLRSQEGTPCILSLSLEDSFSMWEESDVLKNGIK